MNLAELLDRLDSKEYPYYGNTSFFEELKIYSSWANLENNGFTCRVVEIWNCTDSSVGTKAVYRNGKLICITKQETRKSDVEFFWVSREVYKETKDFVHSLLPYEEEPVEIIDFNEEVSTEYKVDYAGQLIRDLHDKPTYKGRVVNIDWDATIKLNREDFLAKEAWVIDCDELKKVPVSELSLQIPIKKQENESH